MKEQANIKVPSLRYSLIALLTIVIIMVIGMILFKAPLQMMMFIGLLVSIPFAMYLGFTYKEVEDFAFDMIRKALQPAMILLAVGALIGAWILSGTVPTLIYAGLKTVTPDFFLISTLVLCTVVSLATGTSWGTIGTAGIAMMGVGGVLGIPAGITAGAVVSGAVFGDKMSPLSDSTNLAPAVSGSSLIPHIKHMAWTTIPAYIITAILFFFIGLKYSGGASVDAGVAETTAVLAETFNIGWIALIPAIVVLILLILKKPAFTSILIGALVGGLIAVLNEGATISETLNTLYNGSSISSENEFLNQLLNRGGVTSMYGIVGLFIFALGLGGILQGSGILQSILDALSKKVKTDRGVIITTMAVNYISNMVGATMSFAAVMTGTMMQPLFRKHKIEPKNLSRTIEDCGTLGAFLIPWNTSVVFTATALGISGLSFIPFVFLSIITPIFTLIYAITGFTLTKVQGDEYIDSDELKSAG